MTVVRTRFAPSPTGFLHVGNLRTALCSFVSFLNADKSKLNKRQGDVAVEDYINISVQEWNSIDLQLKIGEWVKEKGHNNGVVLWPLRVAISGQENSPGPFGIAEALGKEETISRIQNAVSKL